MAALAIATLAVELARTLDYSRVIVIKIENLTNTVWVLDHTYFDCGEGVFNPLLEPNRSYDVVVSKKFGSYGVKGTACYRNKAGDQRLVVLL